MDTCENKYKKHRKLEYPIYNTNSLSLDMMGIRCCAFSGHFIVISLCFDVGILGLIFCIRTAKVGIHTYGPPPPQAVSRTVHHSFINYFLLFHSLGATF